MDILTKSLAKSYTNLVALGLSDVTISGTTVTFTLNDGETASVTLPTPADGKSLEFNVNGNMLGIRVEGDEEYTYINTKGEKGDTGARGLKGEAGENGKSAYELAVENGFEGTIEDWLDSLNGASMSSGTATVIANSRLKGNITPDLGGIYSIGSEDKKLKAIYAEEVYMSSNTLYIDGTPVFHTDGSDDIMMTADEDQSIKVKTTGSASTNVISEQGVEIRTSNEASNINICAGNVTTGTSSNLNLNASNNIGQIANNQITVKAPNVNLEGSVAVSGGLQVDNLNVSGKVTIGGEATTIDTDNLSVKDNVIVINNGETGSGVTAGTAGIRIDRGELVDYEIVFDETDDMFKVGALNSLQTLATQEYVDNALDSFEPDVPLDDYVKTTELNSTLGNYATTSAMNTKFADYTTTTALKENILKDYAKISSLHSHSNKTTLDKLSESNGTLLFNGSAIQGGGSGSSKEEVAISGTAPTNTDIQLWVDTSENISQSVTTAEELNVYSTSETKCGTWVDGKPIYRRVFNTTMPTVTTDGTPVNTAVPNSVISSLGQVVNLTAMLKSNNVYHPLFTLSPSKTQCFSKILYNASGIAIVSSTVSWSGCPVTIIFEYTKTTD